MNFIGAGRASSPRAAQLRMCRGCDGVAYGAYEYCPSCRAGVAATHPRMVSLASWVRKSMDCFLVVLGVLAFVALAMVLCGSVLACAGGWMGGK